MSSSEELLREPGRAIEDAGARSRQAESEVPALILERVEGLGFEDGYLGSKFNKQPEDRDQTSELAIVYEIGYLKGSKQFEIDAGMAERGEWPPVVGLHGDET